jgi:hypothetical protein
MSPKFDYAADLAKCTNAEIIGRLRGQYPGGATYEPTAFNLEVARRMEALMAKDGSDDRHEI